MTLSDLWQCIKRYWYLVIGLPVACAAIAAVVASSILPAETPATYTATTRIITNTGVGTVAGYATNEASRIAAEAKEENPDSTFSISAKGDSATMTVTITASGPDKEQCSEALDTVVSKTLDASRLAFIETYNAENGYTGLPFSATVADPRITEAMSEEEANGTFKIVAVAALAGLLAGLCIVVLIQVVRRSVISVRGIEEAMELPVLAVFPGKSEGERLLANIRFAAKSSGLRSICVIPISTLKASEAICQQLREAIEREGLKVSQLSQEEAMKDEALAQKDSKVLVCCDSLTDSMAPAYAAQKAEATVMVAMKWADSMPRLQETSAELKLAGATLVGTVFLREPI